MNEKRAVAIIGVGKGWRRGRANTAISAHAAGLGEYREYTVSCPRSADPHVR